MIVYKLYCGLICIFNYVFRSIIFVIRLTMLVWHPNVKSFGARCISETTGHTYLNETPGSLYLLYNILDSQIWLLIFYNFKYGLQVLDKNMAAKHLRNHRSYLNEIFRITLPAVKYLRIPDNLL